MSSLLRNFFLFLLRRVDGKNRFSRTKWSFNERKGPKIPLPILHFPFVHIFSPSKCPFTPPSPKLSPRGPFPSLLLGSPPSFHSACLLQGRIVMEEMRNGWKADHVLHPLVMRVIEELRAPSPGVCPRDREQPKQGDLRDLQGRLEARRRTDSYLLKQQEIRAQVQLDNQALTPAPVGWSGQLAGPGESLILQRRRLRPRTESTPTGL